jgi:hypothetical protein
MLPMQLEPALKRGFSRARKQRTFIAAEQTAEKLRFRFRARLQRLRKDINSLPFAMRKEIHEREGHEFHSCR